MSTDKDNPCGCITAGEYAAIQLRVPDSGTPWLDDMIRESLRNELAARAMQGFARSGVNVMTNPAEVARRSDAWADAMMKEMQV